jgi:nucleoside-diphosphate-sugar epimerase
MYKIPTVVIRPMSIYGPYEKTYKFMKRLFNKNIQFINNASHDWTYIDDFVDATICIMNSVTDDIFDIVNIGLGVQRTNHEVVRIVEDLMNYKFNLIEDNSSGKAYDSMNWVCDPTYLKVKHGYECKTTLEDGLTKYYEWFKNSLITEHT